MSKYVLVFTFFILSHSSAQAGTWARQPLEGQADKVTTINEVAVDTSSHHAEITKKNKSLVELEKECKNPDDGDDSDSSDTTWEYFERESPRVHRYSISTYSQRELNRALETKFHEGFETWDRNALEKILGIPTDCLYNLTIEQLKCRLNKTSPTRDDIWHLNRILLNRLSSHLD